MKKLLSTILGVALLAGSAASVAQAADFCGESADKKKEAPKFHDHDEKKAPKKFLGDEDKEKKAPKK